MDAALPLAVTAGMLGAVNPCGFAMLPAYLSMLVVGDSAARPRPGAAVGRALRCTAGLTAGYLAVFGAFGLVLAPAAGWLQPRLPWLTVGLGLLLAAAGGWLVAGRRLPRLPVPARAPVLTGSVASMTLLGAAYALASLSCAVAPFLAIVVAALRAGSTARGVLLFLGYAAGMGLVIGVTALAVALLRVSLVDRLRRAAALAPRVSGALLALAGGYVAYYGWYELRLAAVGRAALGDPVVGVAVGAQQRLAGAVGQLGPAALAGLAGLLLAAGWMIGRRRAGGG